MPPAATDTPAARQSRPSVAVQQGVAAQQGLDAPLRPARPRAVEFNPYAGWVRDYPQQLLAEPSPGEVTGRLGDFAAAHCGDTPILLDLGCGAGNFLQQMAERNPTWRCVGFELRYKRLVKAARKIERAQLDNVWLLRERAERFPLYLPKSSVQRIYVNFPDPWPKRGQWKHRMINTAFLGRVHDALDVGGTFHLKTDHSGYFLHALQAVRGAEGLDLVAFTNDASRAPAAGGSVDEGAGVRTEFEMLFHSMGRPVFELVLQKPQKPRQPPSTT